MSLREVGGLSYWINLSSSAWYTEGARTIHVDLKVPRRKPRTQGTPLWLGGLGPSLPRAWRDYAWRRDTGGWRAAEVPTVLGQGPSAVSALSTSGGPLL